MCGIVGYVGPRYATELIYNGLKRLEYRGYDSAGVAIIDETSGRITRRREVGKLDRLGQLLQEQPTNGHIGIGHTRWATHGAPSARNSHPHASMDGDVVVVHNGIVENYQELRAELQAEGVVFASDTDTEVIVHLIALYLNQGHGLPEATRLTVKHLKGSQAIVAMYAKSPDQLVAVRIGNAGGVTLGVGDGEMFVASDIPAILEHTRQMVFLESHQMAIVKADGYVVRTTDGVPAQLDIHDIPWDAVAAAKGEYDHFMQKEIFEQARTLTDTMRGRVDFENGRVRLPDLELSEDEAQGLERLIIVACGTSAYAGLIGKFLIEHLARLPVEIDYASEFRYRQPILNDRCAVLAITQSGETVDTLAALEEAWDTGARIWSIVNAIGSQAMRLADGYITMQAGPEIGVASTKAFTASIIDLYMLGLYLGELRGVLSPAELRQHVNALMALPDLAGRVLDHDDEYQALAEQLSGYKNFLYLGRGINYPIALEGALKLKEISYIHAEGYPAGEMKHGPIALIDETMPVLTIAIKDHVYDKMLSQIEQARARGAVVIAVATEGDEFIKEKADYVIYVPEVSEMLSPLVTVIPLQLLAYHVATLLNCDVDQPRNLAKSVTVE
ncbi:MAG: glutamine--fructose-6-phosphate transaminase (isomerizing) [Anaerolineae bacterium]|nr:glutamine--fructose-6-phosphate transaminase (isomerizing) [Anaerolineae bacterium]